MADWIDGTVWQANPGKPVLEWSRPAPSFGNCLKRSRIREADISLDTSRFQICLPLDGAETYRKAGQYFEVQPGEYFILNKGQEARAEMARSAAVEGFCFFLTENTLADVHAVTNISAGRLLDMPDARPKQHFEFPEINYALRENALGGFLQKIKQQLQAPGRDILFDWDRFYFELAELLLHTGQLAGARMQAIGATKFATRQEIYRRISRAHNFILEHFSQPLALDEIARVAHISAYHMARLYRQVYGITPHQHILQLRIHRAKELLHQNFSPTETAYALSFSDRRAFAKTFKKLTGVSPVHFQQSIPCTPAPMRIFRA